MSELTNVILERNTASYLDSNGNRTDQASNNQWFNLKVETVEVNVGNNMIARSILSTAGGLVGSDPILNTENYQLQAISIKDVDANDYPASLVPDTVPSDASHEQKMEAALRQAVKSWGPDGTNADGERIDKLYWNGEQIRVVITDYGAREAAQEPRAGYYTSDMELTHIDAHVDS